LFSFEKKVKENWIVRVTINSVKYQNLKMSAGDQKIREKSELIQKKLIKWKAIFRSVLRKIKNEKLKEEKKTFRFFL
jgi:hypothetical protein